MTVIEDRGGGGGGGGGGGARGGGGGRVPSGSPVWKGLKCIRYIFASKL